MERGEGPDAWLGGGYGWAQGPGLRLSGPAAFWELAGALEDGLAASVHGGGALLTGELDPFGAGRRRTNGGAALLEGNLLWAPRGRESYHLYTGLQGHLTILDVRDAAPVARPGTVAVEPDTAVSTVLGVPFGALVPFALGGGWSGRWQADATAFPGGATFFTHGPGGPPARESTRRLDFEASAGTGLRLGHERWRLSAEALLRRSLGLGRNEPVTTGVLLLVIAL
jgi:hypothetical protein